MNNNNGTPLWMPKGSIRAILALSLTWAAIASIFTKQDPDMVKLMFGGAAIAWALYFGTKTGSEKPEV